MKLQNEAWRHRKRRSREEVKRLIDEFEASESDRAEFCRSQGLALSTLQHHLRARRPESAVEEVEAGCEFAFKLVVAHSTNRSSPR